MKQGKLRPQLFLLIIICFGYNVHLRAQTVWKVGPTKTYKTPGSIANQVQKGDIIEIDAAVYENDFVNWSKDNLTIKGVNGRPHFKATQSPANGKAIWVVSGNQVTIDNIEFSGCRVPDKNGAGIRVEGASTIINQCYFHENEMGILQGIVKKYNLTIQHSEFYKNGYNGSGNNHNVYIGNIDTLFFRFNYSHDALIGHELKSRAAVNLIEYNFITNETTADSRTIDLPNGGCSILIGNVITQSAQSSNYHIIGYGMEGLNPTVPNNLFVINNTFVNNRGNGSFIQLKGGTQRAFVYNNIFAGKYSEGLIVTYGTPAVPVDSTGNLISPDISSVGFNNVSSLDLTLKSTSPAIQRSSRPYSSIPPHSLLPQYEFNKSFRIKTLNLSTGEKYDAGAFQSGIKKISETGTTHVTGTSDEIRIAVFNGTAHISNVSGKTIRQIQVTDISGRLVHRETSINQAEYDYTFPRTRQIYILRINSGQEDKAYKVFVY